MRTRTLKSGRVVDEPPNGRVYKLTIQTRCPEKWLFVDLETGDVWHQEERFFGDLQRWRKATDIELREMRRL